MGDDCTVDTATKPQVQTTLLLTPDQEAEIRRLSAEWGNASMASVVRRLLAEALEARRIRAAAGAAS
jgi:hypothetical protein